MAHPNSVSIKQRLCFDSNHVAYHCFPVARIEFEVRLRQWNAASSCESGLQSVAERNWFCHSLVASVGAIVATVIA